MSSVYVALDLEATGMDPERDEVIEIAAIKFRNDRVLDRWESLVQPRGSIPFNITSLTGIGAKDVRRAPQFAVVAPRLRDFVRNHPIVGQSPQFDIEMLLGGGLQLRNPLYDTFKLATMLIPDLPAYTLANIASRLGISVPSQHRAMADVETTMAVFLGLLDLLRDYDDVTLERLASYARMAQNPLARLFDEIVKDMKDEDAGTIGSSIAEQLLAKGAGPRQGPEVMFLYHRERPPKLEATGSEQNIDVRKFAEWSAPGGSFARSFSGYEYRPQQVEMMTSVADTLRDGGTLMVEAGTGTGKSVAYLLPAVLHAVEHGEPVVISTNTIALQDQLFRKDLPDLRRSLQQMAIDDPNLVDAANFEAALLKGRSNYLCLRRWFIAQRTPAQAPEEAALHAKILTWIQQTDTGDRAELHLPLDEQLYWSRLAEEEGSCVPGRCVFHRRNQCFLFRARHKAESAHIVVVNHALLLSDMLASNSVLPAYRNLIIDEAHNLEEEATKQLGFAVGRNAMLEFVNRCLQHDAREGLSGVFGTLWKAAAVGTTAEARALAKRMQPWLETLNETARLSNDTCEHLYQALSDFIDRYQDERSQHERQLRITDAVRHDPGWTDIEQTLERLSRLLRTLMQALTEAIAEVEHFTEEDMPGSGDLATELDLLLRTGNQLLDRAISAISEPSGDTIYWLSRRPGSSDVSIQAAPLHVGESLKQQLYDRCRSVVMTSATLTTDGSFEYVRGRLGVESANDLHVSSPFDYHKSTLLYLANDIPEPGQPGYQRALQDVLIELCRATRGRAMILFTSHSALQSTYRAIKRPLESEGILVLGQRLDGNPRQLVDRIKSRPETILLGTNSFWEGVDIVGDSLSLLVITKLPFSVPSDPVFSARSEGFDEPFHEYAIPQAILRFKQGFGRLIRSSTDRGVCAILDKRIVGRRYGGAFVRSLPDCTVEVGSVTELPGQAELWLAAREPDAVTHLIR
ncbi:MAG TPA: helicase C-terminal domain-containing protein [Nitrolancea sp.]|nr:helicase C-terminal domain-containing protein [Nitrolancea sp.]